ncbi:heterokaryon incompatibility protein-domain-containing protein [Apodospora peruviana]|uniref:Heterokaryon incompatibility protein-domain-containing protein n=1 Tax=Apodospora peruviana TaxID=516989 RepID=A0AAE0MC14_9PEZI|nr:heterokaryon incompatibility protein-domain-containing protein [Apodospora peruviana]
MELRTVSRSHGNSEGIFPTPNNEDFQIHYQELNATQNEIRLIRLHPDLDPNGLIQCDLIHGVELATPGHDATPELTTDSGCLGSITTSGTPEKTHADLHHVDIESVDQTHREVHSADETGSPPAASDCQDKCRKRYAAISYCAGNPAHTRTILVNGVPFHVFANLAHALDITRDFWAKRPSSSFPGENKKECLLWADQICINQSNLRERSHQVGFMRRIYASAEQTLICLSTACGSGGAEEEINTRGVEWLCQLHRVVDPQGDFYMYYFRLEHYLRTRVRSDRMFADDWLAFYDIFQSPWWTRTWVYQEFISSNKIFFLFGRASVPWPGVSEVLPTLRKYDCSHYGYNDLAVRESQARATVDKVNFFVLSKMKFDRLGPYDLMDLLSQSRHLQSTDSRDRIYAFLGLVRQDYGIVPDYSPGNTITKLLVDVAVKIVSHDRRLDVLSYACAARGPLSQELPSWVPDWTCRECRTISPSPSGKMDKGDLASPRIHHTDIGPALEVQGFCIGTVRDSRKSPGLSFCGIVLHCQSWVSYLHGPVEEDDEMWMLVGARDPLVLRKTGNANSNGVYKLIGEMGWRGRQMNIMGAGSQPLLLI